MRRRARIGWSAQDRWDVARKELPVPLVYVVVFVDDVTAAKRWYSDLLGIEPPSVPRTWDSPLGTSASAWVTTRASWVSPIASSHPTG
jgi:hypothetical protein